MKGMWMWVIAGLVAVGLAVWPIASGLAGEDEGEQKVTIDQVPAAVKATILKEAGSNQVTEIEKETKNGKVVYEAEWKVDGKEVEIKVAEDGTLLKKAEQSGDDEEDDDDGEKVTIDQVPEAVKATILKEAGKNEIAEIEKQSKNGKVVYEAEWKVDGKEVEITVAEDGTLIAKEEEITVEQLPEAVKKAVEKELAGAKATEVAKQVKGGKAVYEVEWLADGKKAEAKFAEDGTLLKKKSAEAKKDEKKGEGENVQKGSGESK